MIKTKLKRFEIHCNGIYSDHLTVEIYAISIKGAKQKFRKEWDKRYKITDIWERR